MDRRSFLTTLTAATALLSVRPAAAMFQDVEYERALERVQRERPRVLTSSGRIAPASEPGTPFVIHGRVYRQDGRTPAPGIIVFAYHTDATGHYDVASAGPHSWRLRGWVKTDADGRFEFATIRPAPYPNRQTAAHVHFSIEGPGVPRQSAGLMFEGDPLLTDTDRQASAKAGMFGSVLPVEERDGTQHVTLNIRIGG
jgi:protocatechuate 3,4-dioxygenase beta subunit